jgi:hypothetical protein
LEFARAGKHGIPSIVAFVQTVANLHQFCSIEVSDRIVRVGSISTKLGYLGDVRFPLDSDRTADIADGPVRAKPGSEAQPISTSVP